MTLSELIRTYGDDKVQFQSLDNAIISMDSDKGSFKYKFGSSVPFSINGIEKQGLVVWLDREEVDNV